MFRAILLLSLCPCLGGCLAIGYPSDSVTPAIAIPETDATAFKTVTFSRGPCTFMAGGFTAGWEIYPLETANGKVPSIEEKHFTYWIGCPLVSWHDRRWWSLYLYRPGYDLVEVEPGMAWLAKYRPDTVNVNWRPLASPDEQARVIDKLAGRGLWSNATPAFRNFCADEYEHLSIRFPLASAEQRQLWLKKADDLRKIGTGREPVGQPVNFQQMMMQGHGATNYSPTEFRRRGGD